jgi:hypothetical protein
MSCRNEVVAGQAIRFCPDDPPPITDRVRAICRARVIDEITTQAADVDLTVTTSSETLVPRATRGGIVGLVGQPLRALPTLDVDVVDLDLRVDARGYLPLDLATTIGPIVGYPDVFAAIDLGDVGMHRVAVELAGRTLRRASLAPTVVSGALVRIDGYWPTFPPPNVTPSSVIVAPNLVNVAPGFYAPRDTATGTLRQRTVALVPGADKELLLAAGQGDVRVRLSDRQSLGAGSLLVIDDANGARREYILVDQVDTSSSADQPAWVTLEYPLAHTHLERAVCRVATLPLAGALNALVRNAIPGDEAAFTSALAGVGTGDIVEIDDAAGPPEYHEASLYRATSDVDGYFRLPPIARVAMVLLHAERLGLTPPDDAMVSPEYRVAENRITVMFP